MSRVRWELLALAALAAYPLVPGIDRPWDVPVAAAMPQIFTFAILALGLNVVIGYAGLFQLGIAAFFLIGALITGILTIPDYPFQLGFWWALAAATLGAGLTGVVLGAPTLRLRGDYLAIVTLGFAEVIRYTAINLDEITNGNRGLNPIPAPSLAFLQSISEGALRSLLVSAALAAAGFFAHRIYSVCRTFPRETWKTQAVYVLRVVGVALGPALSTWLLESPALALVTVAALLTAGYAWRAKGAAVLRILPFASAGALALYLCGSALLADSLRVAPDWSKDYRWFYYLTLSLLAAAVALLRNVEQSRLGRALMAIREDELAASCMGVNVVRVKLVAFALGSAIAGFAGSLYAVQLAYTPGPNSFDFNISIFAVCYLIVGGMGNCYGAVLGAFVLSAFDLILTPILDKKMQEWFEGSQSVFLTFSNWRLLVFGLALVLMMRFRPEGILPSARLRGELHPEGR